jgi:hypothetical protein
MRKMSRRNFMEAFPLVTTASLLTTASAAHPVPTPGGATPPAVLHVATFSCDVTPPIGSPLEESDPPFATSVDTPLLAKGVILSDGRTRYALCAFDYCELHTSAHDLFRRKIANAIEVNELQVEVHCIHQHDAPLYDITADMLLDSVPSPPHMTDIDFIESASDRVAAAARDAVRRLKPCTHVGCGKAKVQKFASNRRVPMPDGSIGMRYSSCGDPLLVAAPEGIIDPWLRTITFFDQGQPLVRLHYYASHPQSYYGKGHMNADIPGLARERLEKQEGIPQIYFTGCAGNIAAGKYNDGSAEARLRLAERLHEGMKGAIAATEEEKCSEFSWKSTDVHFALRTDPDFSEVHFREMLQDPNQPHQKRTAAALALAWYRRFKLWPAVDISCYRIGRARILHLPGEAFVEYQLYAQRLRPGDFIAVASYGEGGPGYICTEKAFSEGGYEPTQSLVAPNSEARLMTAIHELLR